MTEEYESVVEQVCDSIDKEKLIAAMKDMGVDITDRDDFVANFEDACERIGHDIRDSEWEAMDGMFIYYSDAIEYLNNIGGWSGWNAIDEFGGFDNINQVAFAWLNDEVNEHGWDAYAEYFFDNYM